MKKLVCCLLAIILLVITTNCLCEDDSSIDLSEGDIIGSITDDISTTDDFYAKLAELMEGLDLDAELVVQSERRCTFAQEMLQRDLESLADYESTVNAVMECIYISDYLCQCCRIDGYTLSVSELVQLLQDSGFAYTMQKIKKAPFSFLSKKGHGDTLSIYFSDDVYLKVDYDGGENVEKLSLVIDSVTNAYWYGLCVVLYRNDIQTSKSTDEIGGYCSQGDFIEKMGLISDKQELYSGIMRGLYIIDFYENIANLNEYVGEYPDGVTILEVEDSFVSGEFDYKEVKISEGTYNYVLTDEVQFIVTINERDTVMGIDLQLSNFFDANGTPLKLTFPKEYMFYGEEICPLDWVYSE